jgi:hypothetical protein
MTRLATREQFDELVADAPEAGDERNWIWEGEVEIEDARRYLVQGLLLEVGVALLSEKWGTYKTFIAFYSRRDATALAIPRGIESLAITVNESYDALRGEL